jgi:hypothetical protein
MVVAIAAAAIFCWKVAESISSCLTAEKALHANRLVIELVREYAVAHRGAWPTSWRDLEQLSPREHALFSWPQVRERVQKYVTVDFAADSNRLVTQPVEQFAAIHVCGPRLFVPRVRGAVA